MQQRSLCAVRGTDRRKFRERGSLTQSVRFGRDRGRIFGLLCLDFESLVVVVAFNHMLAQVLFANNSTRAWIVPSPPVGSHKILH